MCALGLVSILLHLLEWGAHKPEEAVSKESWQKALLNTPLPLPAWLRCPSSFCVGTSCGGGGVNSGSCQDGGGGRRRRCLSQAATGRRWRSRNDGPMGKGRGGMDETQRVGGGCKIKGEEGRGC
jgi:hypothetical protein